MTPAVSMATGVLVYSHSSPPGRFECTVSALRWVCSQDVTLQYNFNDPDIFREELAMLQYTPIGSLMNIKVLTGELLEAHFPHFACLEGSDTALKEAVRILHSVEGGVHLQNCELTRFHAKLLNPSFSLIEVLVKLGIPMKTHLEVLIYRTRVTPLVLLIYVVPRDASMIQSVEEDVHKSSDDTPKMLKTHRPDVSIWMGTKFGLKASLDNAKIAPPQITLKYIRPPDLFRVVMKNVGDCFDLELLSEEQLFIWKTSLERFEYEDRIEAQKSENMVLAGSSHSPGHFEYGETVSLSSAKMPLAEYGFKRVETCSSARSPLATSLYSEEASKCDSERVNVCSSAKVHLAASQHVKCLEYGEMGAEMSLAALGHSECGSKRAVAGRNAKMHLATFGYSEESFGYGVKGEQPCRAEMSLGCSEEVICKEVSKTTRVARASEGEGKLAFLSNTDCLSRIRPGLIKRMSRPLLRSLLTDLQAHSPPVVSSTEAEEILQRSSVLQDQVRSLIDMLLNKGDKACGIMFSLLRELDSYLYEDLGL